MSPDNTPTEPVEIIAEFCDRMPVTEDERRALELRRALHPEEGLIDCVTIAEFSDTMQPKSPSPTK